MVKKKVLLAHLFTFVFKLRIFSITRKEDIRQSWAAPTNAKFQNRQRHTRQYP